MTRPTFCAYLTRRMPVVMRDRLRDEAKRRRANGEHNCTIEDVVNECLALGLTMIAEAQGQVPRKRIDWNAIEIDDEADVLVTVTE